MFVYLNGKFYPEEEAKISVFDRGFIYGDGIFETMRAYAGKIFKLDEHLLRLRHSGDFILLKIPFSDEKLKEVLASTLARNDLKDAILRLTISRGIGERGLGIDSCLDPTIVITTHPLPKLPPGYYKEGVSIVITKIRRLHPDCLNPAIKGANFLNNILAKAEADKAGALEGVMLNLDGFVTEGSTSNIFVVQEKRIFTPPCEVGILRGVTRDTVIALAKESGCQVFEEPFRKEFLLNADEVFLTNTSYEIMPVVRVDDKTIGQGRPGEITLKLLREFGKLLKKRN